MDYGIFAYPFIALYFPESIKMKSVFKYRRTAEEFDKWVNIIAPKKNLKQSHKEEEKEKNKNNGTNDENMTKIEDYILQQFTEVKKDINDIEKYLNDTYNKTKEKNTNINNEEENYDDTDVIEIKITPFFILKFVGFFFLFKIIFFYVKKYLFKYQPLPKNIHQKN
jgi:hypothetical protein